MNPKNPVITKAPQPKSAKKIDMGAATNFGKNDLGINSPTHRNTHAEEDLFSADTTPSNNNNITKPVENMFKTCSPSPTNIKNDNDLDFNPREDENEFGDFASAFGSQTLKDDVPKDFADFGNVGNVFAPAAPTSNNANNLLLDPSPMSMFGQFTNPTNLMTPPSNLYQQQPQPSSDDLLSDFGGLSFSAPVSNGEFRLIFFFLIFFFPTFSFCSGDNTHQFVGPSQSLCRPSCAVEVRNYTPYTHILRKCVSVFCC